MIPDAYLRDEWLKYVEIITDLMAQITSLLILVGPCDRLISIISDFLMDRGPHLYHVISRAWEGDKVA